LKVFDVPMGSSADFLDRLQPFWRLSGEEAIVHWRIAAANKKAPAGAFPN
jgi:hypothetical protein